MVTRLSSPTRRRALLIALALFGAACVSWLRYALAGTLALHGDPLGWPTRIALAASLGLCLATACLFFLRAHRDAGASPRSTLIAGALAIQLAAAGALPLTSSDLFSDMAYG